MNKKKKLVNKKHRRTKARIKALRVTALLKTNKKTNVKQTVKTEPSIEKKVITNTVVESPGVRLNPISFWSTYQLPRTKLIIDIVQPKNNEYLRDLLVKPNNPFNPIFNDPVKEL